jgi:hypothetical protein
VAIQQREKPRRDEREEKVRIQSRRVEDRRDQSIDVFEHKLIVRDASCAARGKST